MNQVTEQSQSHGKAVGRLLGLSAVGIFIFFIPISLQGKTSIPLDHMVGWLRGALGETGAGWYAMAMILAGAVYPLITGNQPVRTVTVWVLPGRVVWKLPSRRRAWARMWSTTSRMVW